MADDAPANPGGFLAQRLDLLFRTTIDPGTGRQFTITKAARVISEAAADAGISIGYLQQLRSGGRDNPTYRQLIALSRFFGVSPAYFFEDAELERGAIPADAALALKDQHIREIALRAAGLSERSLRVIADMVTNARALEDASSKRPRRQPRQPEDAPPG